jgi:outer membrane protein assembly factor BamB
MAAMLAVGHPRIMVALHTAQMRDRSRRRPQPEDDPEAMQRKRYLEAGGRFKRLRPYRLDTEPSPEQEELLEELRAIGYATGSTEYKGLQNVTIHDRDRAYPGYNLYTSGHKAEAYLIDMEGRVLHRWYNDFWSLWPDYPVGKDHTDTQFFRRVYLYENGDLLAIYSSLGIIKLNKDSKVLWANPVLAHHDLEVLPDGRIYLLTREPRIVPAIDPNRRVFDEFITLLDVNGEEIHRISLFDCILNAGDQFRWMWDDLPKGARDLLHSNTLEVLDGRAATFNPAFKAGNILTSFRNTNTIAVIDPNAEKVVWAYKGDFRQQHDPKILPNGRLLLFDNQGRHGRSSVQEYDLRNMTLTWIFRGSDQQPFFSLTCGATQRLPNGNTLVSETDNGRAFEVTPEGRIAWEFYNPHRAGPNREFIASLFEMIRFPTEYVKTWLAPTAREQGR